MPFEAYPDSTKTIPPTITGPGPFSDPPRAGTSLMVFWEPTVSKSQSSEPRLLAVVETKREQATADRWIRKRRRTVGHGDAPDVGERHVDIGLIRRGAPLHAPVDAAFANPLLPDHLALAVGVDGVDHA